MTEVPKIVHERLRAASREEPHPDANLLTAFAEHALGAREREGVLAHLAVCGNCRELVALPLLALDTVSVPNANAGALGPPVYTNEKNQKSWINMAQISWPNLRWAALAAGVVVIASVVLVRPGKHNHTTQSRVTIAATNSAPAIPLSAPPAPEGQPGTLARNDRLASNDRKKPPEIRS